MRWTPNKVTLLRVLLGFLAVAWPLFPQARPGLAKEIQQIRRGP